jgi:hypothetical protein
MARLFIVGIFAASSGCARESRPPAAPPDERTTEVDAKEADDADQDPSLEPIPEHRAPFPAYGNRIARIPEQTSAPKPGSATQRPKASKNTVN